MTLEISLAVEHISCHDEFFLGDIEVKCYVSNTYFDPYIVCGGAVTIISPNIPFPLKIFS